ncbi:MAG: PepSY domain-containing protein, partial [bacterium]
MNTTILRLSFLIFILFSYNSSFSQKVAIEDSFEKHNLKQIQSQKIGREKRDKESNALRAKYNERFVSRTNSSVDSIALDYIKTKHIDYLISRDLSEIKLIETKKSPGGSYAYFEQMLNGIPVYAGFFTIALNSGDTVIYAKNEFRNVNKYKIEKPIVKITPEKAVAIAKKHLDIGGKINSMTLPKLVYFESKDVGLELAWQVNINANIPFGYWLIMVNARNGRIINASNEVMYHIERNMIDNTNSVKAAQLNSHGGNFVDNNDAKNRRIIHNSNQVMYQNGSGMIYNPNPLTTAHLTSHGGNFVDNNDATNADLDNERVQVTLHDITYENGYYSLKGPYCDVYNSPTFTNPNDFNFTRNQDGFEAVMAYYHIDLAGRYVESLGYFDSRYLGEFEVYPLSGQSGSAYVPGVNYDENG